MKLLFATLGSAWCLCQCATPLPGRAEGIDPNPFQLLEQQATASNRDPRRLAVPLLRSPALEQRWGQPRLLVGARGGFALRYQDPADPTRHVTIFGSPEMFRTAGATPPPYTELGMDPRKQTFHPTEVSQPWQTVPLAGRTVRYYISQGATGGEPLQVSTETFRLTAPDGRAASYRIRVSSKIGRPADDVRNLLQSVRF